MISNETFPQIGFRKIVINSDDIEVRCSLMRPRTANYSNVIGIEDINLLSYVKYYFAIVNATGEALLENPDVYYPQKRLRALAKSNPADPINWVSQYENLPEVISFTELSLLDVVSEASTLAGPRATSHTLLANSEFDSTASGSRQTNFQIKMPIPPFPDRPTSYSLVCFPHIDVKSISDDYNLYGFVGQLMQFGGIMSQEKLLEVRSGRMVPPKTRTIFIDEDGVPYSGPTHYHNEPGGYQGLMAGTGENRESMGSKLRVINVPNDKVISKTLIEHGVSFGFDGYSKGSGYFTKDEGVPTHYGEMNFGEQLTKTLSTKEGLADPEKTLFSTWYGARNPIGQAGQNYIQKHIKKLSKIGFYSSGTNLFDDTVPSSYRTSIDVDNQSYTSALILNLEEMLRQNSRFAPLLELHRLNAAAISLAPSGDIIAAASRGLLTEICDRSTIRSINIYRKRVSYDPYGNNKTASGQHVSFQENQLEKLIIVNSGATSSASLQLVDDMVDSPNGIKRSYLLRDFELFNVGVGKYKYEAEITFEDGTRSVLLELLKNFERAISVYSKFVTVASTPFRDKSTSEYFMMSEYGKRDEEDIEYQETGNFDYSKNQFVDRFILECENPGEFFEARYSIYETWLAVTFVLNGMLSFRSQDDHQMVVSKLGPRQGTLANFHYFLGECQKLHKIFKSYIYKTGASFSENGGFDKTGSQNPGNRDQTETLLKIRSETNNLVDANKRNRVMFNAPNGIRLTSNEITPASFFFLDRTGARSVRLASADINRRASPEAAARVMASIRYLSSGDFGLSQAMMDNQDPVAILDSLLTSNRGTTFNSIITDIAGSTTQGNISQESLKEMLNTEFQSSLAQSIFTSRDREHFVDIVEEKYRDHFLTTQSLGKLYEVIIDSLNTDNSVARANSTVSYRDRVVGGSSNIKARETRRSNSSGSGADPFRDITISSFNLDVNSGMVSLDASGPSMSSIVFSVANGNTHGAELANSITINPRNASVLKAPGISGFVKNMTKLGRTNLTRSGAPSNSTSAGGSGSASARGGGY